jgi:predicted aspartyl protease
VKGTLTPSYTPYIDLEVVEAGSLQEMVVDTGFNDYLYLPEDIIVDWNLPFITTSVVSYADGPPQFLTCMRQLLSGSA